MSIKEDYLIADRGSDAYVGELGRGIKPPVSIHAARLCVMDCPVQWDVVMEILGLIIGLVNNSRRHESLPISLGKENEGAPEWCALSILHLSHSFSWKVLVSTHNLAPFTVGCTYKYFQGERI